MSGPPAGVEEGGRGRLERQHVLAEDVICAVYESARSATGSGLCICENQGGKRHSLTTQEGYSGRHFTTVPGI